MTLESSLDRKNRCLGTNHKIISKLKDKPEINALSTVHKDKIQKRYKTKQSKKPQQSENVQNNWS